MTRRRLLLGLATAAGLLALAAGVSLLWMGRDRPAWNTGADGLVLSGYDPVSYFPEGGAAPRPGDPSLAAAHEGRRYHFASEANRERFLADPARYEPRYGGWCAYAVAHDYKFEADPTSYLVVDDRLLVFYRGMLGDAKASFQEEGVSLGVRAADANWLRLRED